MAAQVVEFGVGETVGLRAVEQGRACATAPASTRWWARTLVAVPTPTPLRVSSGDQLVSIKAVRGGNDPRASARVK